MRIEFDDAKDASNIVKHSYSLRRRTVGSNVNGDSRGDPVDAPPILTDKETAAAIARTVRKRLGISQAEFAARFRISVATLRDWEQNRRQPDGAAFAYLRVIAREPEMVARALQPA